MNAVQIDNAGYYHSVSKYKENKDDIGKDTDNNISENNIGVETQFNAPSSSINSSSHSMKAPLPLFQRYEFPVLAEDPASISKARTDPLACNVNNDAVLIWNDVIIRRDDVAFPPGAVTSIEDAFQELQTTVAAYNDVRDCGFSLGYDNSADEVDGVDNENLKERLHIQNHRRHNHNYYNDNNRRGEDVVVSRRRLYEQGVDLPFISKVTSDLENTDKHFSTHNNYNSGLVKSNSSEIVRNEDLIDFQHIENCKNDTRVEQNILGLGKKSCERLEDDNDSIDGETHLEESRGSPRKARCSYKVLNGGRGVFFTTEHEEEDSGVEKSYLDSGHFEDLSTGHLSSYRSSTGSDVFYSDECYENCQILGEAEVDRRRKSEEDNVDEKDDLLFDGLENSVKHENSQSSFDDSDVFIETGKENESITDIRDSGGKMSLQNHNHNRSRRKPSHLKRRRNVGDKKIRNKNKEICSVGKEKVWRDDTSVLVQCARNSCQNVSNLVEARKSFKNCHHCLKTYYCSRECRKLDWVNHKEEGVCHGSRVSSACKKVIRHCNTNPEIKAVLSRLAVRGYLAHGRGCVMLGFPDFESTEEFMEFGFPMLELNPIYVSAKELSESKMYGNVLEKLLQTCKAYKPDLKFVLNVGVGLRFNKEDFLSFSWQYQGNQYCYRNQNHEEMDTFDSQGSDLGYGSLSSNLNTSGRFVSSSSAPCSPSIHKNRCRHCFTFDNSSQRSPSSRHKAPILQKFIKLKLSPPRPQQEHEKRLTFEKHFWDEFRTTGPTLILTSIPERSGSDIDQRGNKKRELTFINIQRKLRERNVDLRQQYPLVHAHLIAHVTKGIHFPSQVLFPVDTKSGRTFTCFMMPEAEAELEWMQSHHLLNDIELSKDSLNKSMSKSFSSSMPSLHSQSQMEINFLETKSKQIPQTFRSVSFNQLDSFDIGDGSNEALNSSVPSTTLKVKERSKENEKNSKHSPHKNVRGLYSKPVDKLDLNNSVNSEKGNGAKSQIKTALPTDGPDLLLPLDIHIVGSNKSTNPKAFDNQNRTDHNNSFPQNTKVVQPDEEKLRWATNQDVHPSYYPVRKARNVKLYSHSNSRPKSPKDLLPPTPHQNPTPTAQISIRIPSPNSSLPLAVSPSLSTLPTPKSLALSPALYTSTPKTTKAPPVFEDLIPSSPFPNGNSNQTPRSHTTHATMLSSREDSSCDNDDIMHKSNCFCEICINEKQNKRDLVTFSRNDVEYVNFKSANGNDSSIQEYGFDSCYRNKVVVDEVDDMKRRRKDRKAKSNAKGKSSSAPHLSLHAKPNVLHDLEYYWFDDTTLLSPPLATSTLDRRKLLSTSEEHKDIKRSKRKIDRHNRKSYNVLVKENISQKHYDGHVHNKLCTANDFTSVPTHNGVFRVNCNQCIAFENQDASMYCENKKRAHSCIFEGRENSDNNDMICAKNGHVSLSSPLVSASSRRKFNTNSPYFPRDYRISKSPFSQSDLNDYDNISDNLSLENRSQNKPSKYTSGASKNRKTFQRSTIHIASNSDNFIDNDKPVSGSCHTQSSPFQLDNTLKASKPKKLPRNHSNINNNMPLNPYRCHYHHNDPHQHQLRMRIFENVTQHLTNKILLHETSNDTISSPSPKTSSSKRKIKFNLPDFDDYDDNTLSTARENNQQPSTNFGHLNKGTKHSFHKMKPKHQESSQHVFSRSSSDPFSAESSIKMSPRHLSLSQLSPIRNVSYSSDW